jgi:FKBP-type peptidyl-prolyl cis-trans isomerase
MKHVLTFLTFSAFVMLAGCTKCSQSKQEPGTPPVLKEEEVKELRIVDVKEGTGAVAQTGKTVTVHYTGTLFNGTKFDSSLDRNQPFSFPLGAGQVIPGWELGVAGMKVGGKRKLYIPPNLGYGERGAGGVIPPNAVLVFDIELLNVQ